MASDSLEEFLAENDEEGTHSCVTDGCGQFTGKDGRVWTKFVYVVDDESNDLDGEEFTEMYQDFSHLTRDDFKKLPSDERSRARRSVRDKQKRLSTLGVSEEKLTNFQDWESLDGIRVSVVVETWSKTKTNPDTGHDETTKGTNIRSVTRL